MSAPTGSTLMGNQGPRTTTTWHPVTVSLLLGLLDAT